MASDLKKTDLRLSPDEILRRLSGIELLRALPPEEMHRLVGGVHYEAFPAGTCLMRQGETGRTMYFLEKGTAAVRRDGTPEVLRVESGSVVGEMALFTGAPRSADVTAETDLEVWRIDKEAFDRIIEASPELRKTLHELVEHRLEGTRLTLPHPNVWVATALRSLEAQYRGLRTWQWLMGIGLAFWFLHLANQFLGIVDEERYHLPIAFGQFLTGLLILQGACESYVTGVERLGARLRWDGFISGTIGSLLSTLPEFVVIGFLVLVEPLAAFVTAVVTIFNNALAFSVYSFFLPKDRTGCYAMPRSLTNAGGEILIPGAAITLIVGAVMLVMRVEHVRTHLVGVDLLVIALVLMMIYAYYLVTLVRYYAEGQDNLESLPPDPGRLGHDTSIRGIAIMFALGTLGAYAGGEAIGGFAETLLKDMHLPIIPTSAALAFFAGISEYIIVYKSHQRGELGIALSNVFGGLTQVMFLLLPFGLLVIGLSGLITGQAHYAIPINVATCLLLLLLFPLFYTLHQHIEQEKNITNLDAAAMTGVYVLLLYFLFTYPE